MGIVSNPLGDMYFTVGGVRHYNLLLAMQDSKGTGHEVKFHYFDEIFEDYDWAQDYTKTDTWENLCKQRALEIRRDWKKVRVWFSGGRDSYTTLKSFINNDIFIDEIVVVDFGYKGAEFPFIVQWLKTNQHLFHPNTKITQLRTSDALVVNKLKANWAEDPNLGFVTPVLSFPEIQKYLLHKDAPDDTAEVTGFEKPRVVVDEHGNWQHYLTSNAVKTMIGFRDHVPFFISKGVPIYQYNVHYMINYISDVVIPKYNITDPDVINTDFFATAGWTELKNGTKVMTNEWAGNAQLSLGPYYFESCKASLREEFADLVMGMPYHKLTNIGSKSKRINTAQYREIETGWENYYPELWKLYKDGVFIADTMYAEYFVEESALYQPKDIHTDFTYIKTTKVFNNNDIKEAS